MISFFRSIFAKPAANSIQTSTLPAKNPLDFTLTASSSEWHTEHYCRHCYATCEHREIISGICNSCGGVSDIIFRSRAARQIWDGSEWVRQERLGNSTIRIISTNGVTTIENSSPLRIVK